MPSDSDPIYVLNKPDDILSVILSILSEIKFKFVFLVFIAFLMLSSDVFVNKVLSKISNATDLGHPTSYGTVIQGLLLAVICIALDGFINQGIV